MVLTGSAVLRKCSGNDVRNRQECFRTCVAHKVP